jgi:hypothetical protein
MSSDGGPAFPQQTHEFIPDKGHFYGTEGGMSLRAYLAGQALARMRMDSLVICAGFERNGEDHEEDRHGLAADVGCAAVWAADATLKALGLTEDGDA